MALVPCPDCNNQVSSEAWACPKCGRPIRGPQYGRRFTIALIVMIFAVVAVSALMNLRQR